MNKIFMDLKVNEYSLNARVISLALMDNTKFERVLYLENSEYDILENTGWLPGDKAVKNRLLVNGVPDFSSNISAKYIPKANFIAEVNSWLENFNEVQILTENPMSWLMFVSLYGSIENLPKRIRQTPIFLRPIFLAKGLDPDTDISSYIKELVVVAIDSNALHDVYKLKAAYNKLLVISKE